MRFQWKPSEQDLTNEDGVSGRTMVRFSLTALSLGWMSIDGYPARALIAVPDRHNVFERENEEGELEEWSEVEVPASVIYQLPTTNSQFYTEQVVVVWAAVPRSTLLEIPSRLATAT